MKKILLHPLFLFGVIIRLLLIFTVQPLTASEWYVPFLSATTSQLTLDPWAMWISQGGNQTAYPYGYMMWLVFIPLILLSKLFDVSLLFGYSLTLLLADFSLLMILRKMLPKREKLLLAVYWLSPIVLLATYGLGLNDIIPVLLLVLSLYFVQKKLLLPAGAMCIAAISAKLSMVIALPFFMIYLIHNRAIRQLMPDFIKGVVVALFVFGLPFVASSSGLDMLLSNPLMDNIYQFTINIGHDTQIYVVPFVYLVMLYAAWRVQRLNFELFQSILGISFLLVVLLTPASPGWFLWTIPLLVFYQAMSGKIAITLNAIFSVLYVVSTLLAVPEVPFSLGHFKGLAMFQLPVELGFQISSLLHTSMLAVGSIFAIRIWREMISRNDYFRLSRKPLVIGIAGDSGSGKETYSTALEGLFGSHSVTKLSSNNYHRWDNQKPIWQVMTHLNPMANDLEAFANDLVSLTDGKSIFSRQYDKQTGKASRSFQVNSNDFILASGLHALYLPILRSCYSLSIYLDIDESLRHHLMLHKDAESKGKTEENISLLLEKEEPDAIQFIRPQISYADLVLSLQPIHPRILDDAKNKHPLRFKLLARSKHGLNELSLTRVLVGVCGLHIDMVVSNDASEVELIIEGETSADDIALAANILCPHILEFLDIYPKWENGVIGLMQLITLSHINQVLTKRFI